ncbi:MAG: hypothetical protein MPN21_08930 [Thermoanaerobaculia bacterium]|nr:hypothetical protein [Thermoanaerobaculia bacterium]
MNSLRPSENPFRTSRVESLRYADPDEPTSCDIEDRLLERWVRLGRRAALVGPKGHGKTTLLEQLEHRLEGKGYEIRRLRFRTEDASLPSTGRRRMATGLHGGVVISIDGLELLGPWAWWRLRRAWTRVGGLLATVHRRGRLPVLHVHKTTPELLRSLVHQLLDDEATFRRIDRGLGQLFERHEGNIRKCLHELYDQFAGKPPHHSSSGWKPNCEASSNRSS